ncbi:hypothetical protein P170DRAFT_437251 [Aspergillus steynii IBT 23096]|uniref:Uncharacterized protein n=1 Tax=Aspergillus steynii IBT 23096 TaxID=1392250 RepID=A0A2I2GA28_9EURO|nr:uncharacterized protein P170DRAFT_437251 [Aspergillus steynii IBT 23096]PLB49713.1 hypothetical protein P170DRAFT_437251 [Aspergillus steynii IBT 23096]
MKISLALSALALLACPAAAVDLNPTKDCSEPWSAWNWECKRSASNCCHYAAEKANTTCPMSRSRHYFLLGRCSKLFEGSASPYNKTDCVSASLSGIALIMGDRGLDFPVHCTIDDIKDMP